MRKQMCSLFLSLTTLVLSGCVTMPMGPNVMVMPGSGKTFEQFQVDDITCRRWSEQQLGMSPQDTVNQNIASGAAVGTILGAGVGAALGAAAGDVGAGAAIGAGSGLLIGSSSGASSGQAYGWEAQRRYDIAYQQCMYAKGNQVPAVVRRSRRSVTVPPPGYNSVPPDYTPSYPTE